MPSVYVPAKNYSFALACSRSNCSTSRLQPATTLILIASELDQMHLIRAIDDLHRTAVRPHVSQRGILAHARATICLDGAVDDIERDLGHEDLGLGDLLQRELGVLGVDHESGVEDGQTGRVDFDSAASYALEHHAVLVQLLAEGLLLRVVHAAWRAHVLGWDAHVVEDDVAVAVRSVVEAVDGQHALNGDARGVGRDEHDGLLLVDVGVVRIALAHDHVDLAARVTGTGRPPLRSVQYPLVALLVHPESNVGCIGAGHIRLRHEERRSDLALKQRLQPPILLHLGTVLGEDFHVARVWGSTVGGLGGNVALAEVLSHQAVFEVTEASALLEVVLGQEHVPQAELAGTLLEVFEDGRMGSAGMHSSSTNFSTCWTCEHGIFWVVARQRLTISRVFCARSLTNGYRHDGVWAGEVYLLARGHDRNLLRSLSIVSPLQAFPRSAACGVLLPRLKVLGEAAYLKRWKAEARYTTGIRMEMSLDARQPLQYLMRSMPCRASMSLFSLSSVA
ncbi:acyl-CoA dehydrogenase NM domain-like protein [Hortaea werneckii]|nr:acyl-CoA dehydrogenase NM domain-like protein [Hortaea werneckii]